MTQPKTAALHVNTVVIAGRIAAPPELRELDPGTRLLRYLVATESGTPTRRVDVIPVTKWDPSDVLVADPGSPGMSIEIVGSVQRRFWAADMEGGRRSRLEIVADDIVLVPVPSRVSTLELPDEPRCKFGCAAHPDHNGQCVCCGRVQE